MLSVCFKQPHWLLTIFFFFHFLSHSNIPMNQTPWRHLQLWFWPSPYLTYASVCICIFNPPSVISRYKIFSYEAAIIQMQHCFWIILMTVYNPQLFSFFYKRLANSLVSLLSSPQLVSFPPILLNHSVEPLWLPCNFCTPHHMFRFLHKSFHSSETQPLSKSPSPTW